MADHTPVPGELIQLVRSHGNDNNIEGRVASGPDELLVVRIPRAIFAREDVVRAQYVVPDDARYTVTGIVESLPVGQVAIRPLAQWARVQQRESFRLRISATLWAEVQNNSLEEPGLPTDGKAEAEKRGSPDVVSGWVELKARVVDMSAGGLQVEGATPMKIGERVRVHFDLPKDRGTQSVHATALVARIGPKLKGMYRCGLRFTELEPHDETAIVRFIYQQQALRRQQTIV